MVKVIDGCKVVINPLCPPGQAYILNPKYLYPPEYVLGHDMGKEDTTFVIVVASKKDLSKLTAMLDMVVEQINELKKLRNFEKI